VSQRRRLQNINFENREEMLSSISHDRFLLYFYWFRNPFSWHDSVWEMKP